MSSPGPDDHSSVGGPGWVARQGSHEEDLAAGRGWTRCGCRSEVAPLRSVMLAWPPDSIGRPGRAEDRLMVEEPDLQRMRAQAAQVAEAYRRHGVEVHTAQVPGDAPPNVVFMRDLFLMTPAGAVVSRMASAQRSGEELHAARALTSAGIPIVATVTGSGTFEGADALWLDDATILVGTGFRTNDAGAAQVRQVLAAQGISVVDVPLPAGVQHLLGALTFVADDLVAVHAAAVGPTLWRTLADRGFRLIDVAPDDELLERRCMNFVTLRPYQVLMPAGGPALVDQLRSAGVDVDEVDVGEYVKAAGGLGCLTGVLHREA